MTDPHATPPFDRMRDHWWWRPGWRMGRSFYTWHLTFDHATDVHRLAAEYADALRIPGLDVIPPRWLHLTMQGLGFTDEVTTADVDAIVEAAGRRLAAIPTFDVVLGPAVIDPEVVRLQVAPAQQVAAVREAIRGAVADVWTTGGVPEAADFVPHVSLAYSNSDGPSQPIMQAVESVRPEPALASISEAQLIILNRDSREYQWTTYAMAGLASVSS